MRFRLMFSVLGGIVGIAVIATITCLVWERAIVWAAGNQFRNELAELKRLTFRQDYVEACLENGTKLARQVAGVQLRFISDTDYVIEPVCQDSYIKAEPLKKGSVWGGVKRLYGSGIFIPIVSGTPELKDGWLQLTKGKTSIAAGFFNGQTEIRWQIPETVIGGDSPAIAGCTDWGFSCCQPGNTEGVGVQAFPSDCVNSCFQSCNQRPVILFFNTEPRMNKERVVYVESARATIKFGFEIADFDGGVNEATLDFGDGEISPPLFAKEPSVSHEYACFQTTCYYEVTLSGTDTSGFSLAEGQMSKILVVMQP